MRSGQGFLCVFSVVERKTFEEINTFHDQITRAKDAVRVPMVLVGNKCDLEKERKVTTNEGMALAKNFGCPYIETSAKLRTNVEQAFEKLVREIKSENPTDTDPDVKPKKKGGCTIL